jgi:holin-like protein
LCEARRQVAVRPGKGSMEVLHGITILLVYQLVCEVGVRFLGLPLPGPVLGMLLLFLTLLVRRGPGRSVEDVSGGLLAHLSLLFVPAGVGLMVHWDRLAAEWLPIAAALLLSTVLTMAFCAGLMLGLRRLLAPGGGDDA